jgi:hypothetical protein
MTSRIQIQNDSAGVTLRVKGGKATLSVDEVHELVGELIECAARAQGLDPDEQDWTRVPMQHLIFAVESAPEIEPEDRPGQSARVLCWVRGQTRKNAFHVAVGWISEDGWIPSELLEQRTVTRTDFEGSEDLRYYEQALTDGEVFKFEIEEPE